MHQLCAAAKHLFAAAFLDDIPTAIVSLHLCASFYLRALHALIEEIVLSFSSSGIAEFIYTRLNK
jgi:hypothetical protein